MVSRRRFMLVAPLQVREVADDAQARAPTPDDVRALGALLHDAFEDTVDDDGESVADARGVVEQLFAGAFGEFLWQQSEVNERAGRIVCATLLTRWQGLPFVAFTLTSPLHQGRGLARAGLLRAMNRLAAEGQQVLRLVVTQGNEPAERLYERLGFRPEAQAPVQDA